MAEKGGYRHFMLKEIFEQPRAVADTFRARSWRISAVFLNKFDIRLKDIARVYIIACGTSWHAGLIGRHLVEEFLKVPPRLTSRRIQGEKAIIDKRTLIIAISQSGETADTLAAVKEAKKRGHRSSPYAM